MEESDLGNGGLVREPIGVCGLITLELADQPDRPQGVAGVGCGLYLRTETQRAHAAGALIYTEILRPAVHPGTYNLVNGEGPVVGSAMSCHPTYR